MQMAPQQGLRASLHARTGERERAILKEKGLDERDERDDSLSDLLLPLFPIPPPAAAALASHNDLTE